MLVCPAEERPGGLRAGAWFRNIPPGGEFLGKEGPQVRPVSRERGLKIPGETQHLTGCASRECESLSWLAKL